MVNSTIATICETVFALPYQLAAITTPSLAATMRTPETMNSASQDDEHHPAGQGSQLDERQQAAATRILSASRIHELSEIGDFPPAAGQVAVKPVGA